METGDVSVIVDLVKTTGSALSAILFFCLFFVTRQWIKERAENQDFERQMLVDATKAITDVSSATREMAAAIESLDKRQETIINNQAQSQSMIRALARRRERENG